MGDGCVFIFFLSPADASSIFYFLYRVNHKRTFLNHTLRLSTTTLLDLRTKVTKHYCRGHTVIPGGKVLLLLLLSF